MTIKDEIARQIKLYYHTTDLDYSYTALSEDIIQIINKEIDKRLYANTIDPQHWSEDAREFYKGYGDALRDLKGVLKMKI